jgi:hypothetical protein
VIYGRNKNAQERKRDGEDEMSFTANAMSEKGKKFYSNQNIIF